jgi:hypothetical protein
MTLLKRLFAATIAAGILGGAGWFLQEIARENIRAADLLDREGRRIPARLSSELEIEHRRWGGPMVAQFYEFTLNGVEYRGKLTKLKSEFRANPYITYLPSQPNLHIDTTQFFRDRASYSLNASYVLFGMAAVASAAILLWPRPTSP